MPLSRNDQGQGNSTPWLLGIALALLTLAVYGQVASFSFLSFDDPEYVTENRFVRQGITGSSIAWAWTTGHASNWHPLTWLSLMLDRSLFGDWAGGFHLTNAFLHLLNVLLLYFWLYRWTGEPWKSAFVAALFAVHPQHAESVAWITERKDVLSTFFGLLAILAYGAFVRTRSWPMYVGLITCYALSLLSKQMFVTLPVLLLLLDWWPLERWKGRTLRERLPLVWEKLPVFALGGLFAVIVFYVQRTGGAVSELASLPLELRLKNAIYSAAMYLWQTFVPTGLAFYYPHPVDRLTSLQVLASGAALLAISIGVGFGWRRAPYLLAGWLWFLVTLLPVIGIIQIGKQGMADRYMYVPHIGIFWMVTWGLGTIFQRMAVPAMLPRLLGCSTIAVYAVVGFLQVGTWRDNRTLAERALAVTTDNAMALQVMGESYMLADQPKNALPYFQQAATLTPEELTVQSSLAVALEKLGRPDEAMQHYRQAAERHPSSERALNNLGRALVEQGDIDAGIVLYRKVLELKPDSVVVHNNLAMALERKGDAAAAREHYQLAIGLDPTNVDIRANYGAFLSQQGQADEAMRQFEEVLRLDPANSAARGNVGTLLAQQGKLDLAMQAFRDALAIDPEAADLRAKLARGYLALGQVDAAVQEYRRALAVDAEQGDAANDLAWILATSKKYRDPQESLRLLDKVTERRDAPEFLDTLAAAQAANGEFDQAVATAQQAVRKARAAGMEQLADQLAARAKLYEQKQAYRDPSLP